LLQDLLFPLDPFDLDGYFDLKRIILSGRHPQADGIARQRIPSLKATLDSSFLKIRFSYLYALNIGANVFGFLIIALLNLFTPLEFFKIQRAFLLAGGWVTIVSFYPLVVSLGILFQYIVQRPISIMINRLRLGLKIEAGLEQKAKRRTLNLPVIIGVVNFAMWIGLTALLGIFFMIFMDASLRIGFFLVFRGFMVGYIAAIISFFMVEAHVRRRLIRFLFPEGRLAAVPGTVKFSILRRIRVLYGVGTLAPMIILVGTLAYILWEMGESGGDYYDFPDTNETHPGNFSVVVGDVSGHGISSALLMATGRAFIRQRSALPGNLEDMVSDVNRQLTRDIEESGGFMTLFYLMIDPADRKLCWVRAGHDPAIFYDPLTDTFEELRGAGMALGVYADGRYKEYQKTGLKKGQIVVLGSDGLWEARNPIGEMFGKDSICQIIRSNPEAAAREMLTSCFNALSVFLGDCTPEDDVTMVVVKITKD
jgi:hypothetical protein